MLRTICSIARHSLFILLLAASFPAARGAEQEVALRVTDEQGQPIERFEVMYILEGVPSAPNDMLWEAGANGVQTTRLDPLGAQKVNFVVVRADGFASALQSFSQKDQPKLFAEGATVKLSRGQRVLLQITPSAGMELPEGFMPTVYFSNCQNVVSNARLRSDGPQGKADLQMLAPRAIGPGSYDILLAEDSPPIRVAVDAPGFLQFFDSGPLEAAWIKDGKLSILLPEPAELTVRLDTGDVAEEDVKFGAVNFGVFLRSTDGRSQAEIVAKRLESPQPKLELKAVPPGNYTVLVTAEPKTTTEFVPGLGVPGTFRNSAQASVRSGESKELAIKYVPFDPDAARGEFTARLLIKNFDGTVPTTKDVKVVYADRYYTPTTIFTGKVPESGELVLENLSGRKPSAGQPGSQFTVQVNNEHLGSFSFTKGIDIEDFTFRLPPTVDDLAPDIELTNIATGKTLMLSDFRGQIVCIDFWATWCGPCQEPMAQMDQLSVEKKEDWKGKVALVPISIDDRMETVPPHLNQRDWTHLDQYWTGSGGAIGWKSPAPAAFVVNAVPTTLILDREGRILWRGHPSSKVGGKNLEDRLDDLAGQ